MRSNLDIMASTWLQRDKNYRCEHVLIYEKKGQEIHVIF